MYSIYAMRLVYSKEDLCHHLCENELVSCITRHVLVICVFCLLGCDIIEFMKSSCSSRSHY
jgi:hypothetical protein